MAERQLRSRLYTESAMSNRLDLSNTSLFEYASKHRRQAATCGRFAATARSAADRELLLRLQRSLLSQARYEEWVDGLPPLPPARATALAVPRRT
jgi:hypothetical protein